VLIEKEIEKETSTKEPYSFSVVLIEKGQMDAESDWAN
jgi:hypothetical protein